MVFQGLLLLLLLCGVVYGNTPPHPTGTPPHTTVTPPHTTVPPQPTDSECDRCRAMLLTGGDIFDMIVNNVLHEMRLLCLKPNPFMDRQKCLDLSNDLENYLNEMKAIFLPQASLKQQNTVCSHLFSACVEKNSKGEPMTAGVCACNHCKEVLETVFPTLSKTLKFLNMVLNRILCHKENRSCNFFFKVPLKFQSVIEKAVEKADYSDFCRVLRCQKEKPQLD